MSRKDRPLSRTAVKVEPSEIDGDGYAIRVSGDYELVGDVLVPTFLELEIDGDASTPKVTGRVELRNGAPCVVDLHHDATGCGDIRQTHIREVQVDALIELLAGWAVRLSELPEGRYEAVSAHRDGSFDEGFWRESVSAMRAARGNRKITDELLQQVAATYRANIGTGPTKAVRDRFFVSASQASNYIYQARRAGYLPPTSPGKKRA